MSKTNRKKTYDKLIEQGKPHLITEALKKEFREPEDHTPLKKPAAAAVSTISAATASTEEKKSFVAKTKEFFSK